ncbi:MAG: LamG domain-containing protein, partial [bacterium]|nr:LamG domain-containing protein [bacterium]
SSLNTYASSQWHHVVFVNTGVAGEQKIYVNGVDDSEVTASETSSFSYTGPHSIRLGRRGVCNDSYRNGKIDDVRIWNRALSSTEIQMLYDSYQ